MLLFPELPFILLLPRTNWKCGIVPSARFIRSKNGNNDESSATKSQAHSVPAIEVSSKMRTSPLPLRFGRNALSSESRGTLTGRGLDFETKIFSASGRGGNFSLDIPFYRTQRALRPHQRITHTSRFWVNDGHPCKTLSTEKHKIFWARSVAQPVTCGTWQPAHRMLGAVCRCDGPSIRPRSGYGSSP
jgi:hypothetical protein